MVSPEDRKRAGNHSKVALGHSKEATSNALSGGKIQRNKSPSKKEFNHQPTVVAAKRERGVRRGGKHS